MLGCYKNLSEKEEEKKIDYCQNYHENYHIKLNHIISYKSSGIWEKIKEHFGKYFHVKVILDEGLPLEQIPCLTFSLSY